VVGRRSANPGDVDKVVRSQEVVYKVRCYPTLQPAQSLTRQGPTPRGSRELPRPPSQQDRQVPILLLLARRQIGVGHSEHRVQPRPHPADRHDRDQPRECLPIGQTNTNSTAKGRRARGVPTGLDGLVWCS
jgi:hypothetical protein